MLFRYFDWDPRRIDADGPGLFREALGMQKLPRFPVEDVVKPIAVGPVHQVPGLPVVHRVRQDRHLAGVIVVFIIRGELVVPAQLPGGGIEGDDAAGVEIGAGTHVTHEVGSGIADAPIDHVQRRVV